MKPEDALVRLVKKYGIRRAMTLFGAASVAAQGGWEALVAPDGYTRQGVWTWKRDLEAAGVDPFAVEWGGYEKRSGSALNRGLARIKESAAEARKRRDARAARGRATS